MDRYTESDYKTTAPAEPLRKSTEFEALQYRLLMENNRAYEIERRISSLLGKFTLKVESDLKEIALAKPYGLLGEMDFQLDILRGMHNRIEEDLSELERII